MRRVAAVIFFALAWGLGPGPGVFVHAQNVGTPQFRGGAVLVTVDAYPQENGRIVEGLKAEDFEVFEDGKPQKVEAFDFVRVEPAPFEAARIDPKSIGEANAAAADPKNRVFVVYLDAYHVRDDGSRLSAYPLLDTLRQILGVNDLFGVMTPFMRGRDLTLSRRLDQIEHELTSRWAWGQRDKPVLTADEAALSRCTENRNVQDGAAIRPLYDVLLERLREDKTLASIEDLIAYLATLREARTDVLMFTDGWRLFEEDANLANTSTPALPGVYPGPGGLSGRNPQSYAGDTASCNSLVMRLAQLRDGQRFRDLMTEANRHNISFYPVNPGGLAVFDSSIQSQTYSNPYAGPGASLLGQDSSRLRDRIGNLRTLAENTDGIAVVDNNDLRAGLAKVVNDVSAYYLLGYYATNAKLDGKYHRIQVKMKRPNTTVKARRGYFAPNENKPVAAPAPSAEAAAAASPVTEALGALGRVRSTSDFYTYGVAGAKELRIVTEIAGELIAAGKWAQGGDVQATVTGPSGEAIGTSTGKIDAATRATVLKLPLNGAAAGPFRANIKITAGSEALEDRVSIEPLAPGPLLGAPMLYRAAPGPRSPVRPVADFQFHRTERVHLELPELKPLDQRQARVLGKTGQPLAVTANVSEPPGNGDPILAIDVNLAPLSAGDYVIEVTVGAGAETEKRLIAFRVIQ